MRARFGRLTAYRDGQIERTGSSTVDVVASILVGNESNQQHGERQTPSAARPKIKTPRHAIGVVTRRAESQVNTKDRCALEASANAQRNLVQGLFGLDINANKGEQVGASNRNRRARIQHTACCGPPSQPWVAPMWHRCSQRTVVLSRRTAGSTCTASVRRARARRPTHW